MIIPSFSIYEDYSTGMFIYTSCPQPPLMLISQQLGQSSPIILMLQLHLFNDKQSQPSKLTFIPLLLPIRHINPATWNPAFLEVFFSCATGITTRTIFPNFQHVFRTSRMFKLLQN